MTPDPESRRRFEALLFEQLPVLHAVARRLTRNPSDADDLVQEACLRAYRFFDRFEPGTNFRAWIIRILKNLFINDWHSRQAAPALVDFEAAELSYEHDTSRLSTLAALGDPEAALDRVLIAEDFEAAIGAMPAEYRMVVTLCLVEGFSYKEAADALEIPIGTVMSRLHRGRKHLQARLLDQARARGIGLTPSDATPPPAGEAPPPQAGSSPEHLT